jgi:hypothetical protein
MGKDCFGFSAISDLPCYIRNKFQSGFPVDWKEVKLAWEKYEEQGEFLYKKTKGLLRIHLCNTCPQYVTRAIQ